MRAIADTDDPDRLYDSAARFAHAVDLADRARRQWHKAGEPLIKDSGSAVHPLVVVMSDAERDAKRFGEALGLKPGRAGRPGRNPVAVTQADLGESPSAKLRRVK